MQQHLMQMQPIMAAYYPNNVTTDHIQQYLDENKSLILKIVESQNTGKLSECAENQSRLQRNLMYLAAIADSQPQPPPMPGQYPSSGMMQQGAHYMQAQQAQQMSQQQLMASRSSLLYAQQPFSVLQQQQGMHNQLGMSSSGTQGLHMLQNEATNATMGSGGFPDFVRIGGGKQDIGGSSGEGRGGSSSGHSGDGGETLYLKSAADGN
ncbi:GRF1-interacting factor 1 isoform X1 [Cajanus cajan]|uniref:Protein SSXT n=1 Tax=Cajanus cajan TaxID=3821 RepID=A0A151U592_CAJCA|nr:GRF1-interacting factor 1 isoform X1 [Cajanus cajan]KYP74489.1 Protein SSXT [Cajanus cajan]